MKATVKMKNFNGKILFLDRSDINTDEIIPAKYLTELTKAALKPYCLEDLNLPGFDPKKDIAGKSVIITRANFGCGSSREHARRGCSNATASIWSSPRTSRASSARTCSTAD